MSQLMCRLCLSNERLICIFDARLSNAQQLRMCILLCTGVDIKETDLVSKLVCQSCCTVAVKLFKYRVTAVANDKKLKKLIGQEYLTPISGKEEILELHSRLLGSVSQTKVTDSVAKFCDDADIVGSADAKLESKTVVTEPDAIAAESQTVAPEIQNVVSESHTDISELEPAVAITEPQPLTTESESQPSASAANSENIVKEIVVAAADPENIVKEAVTDSTDFVANENVNQSQEDTSDTEEMPELAFSDSQASDTEESPEDAINESPAGTSEIEESPEIATNSNVECGDIHSSVKQLLSVYPNIILPNEALISNITPSVPVDKFEANKYLDQLQYCNYENLASDETKSTHSTEKVSDMEVDTLLGLYNEDETTESIQIGRLCKRQTLTKLRLYTEHLIPEEPIVCKNEKYYIDPDYYGERSFKSRKRKFGEMSENSCSDCDSSSDLENESHASSEISTRSSRSKIPKMNYQTDSESEEDFLGVPNSEERVRMCEYCDKVCFSRSQLRHHESLHRKCIVCHKIYRTDEAFEMHLKNVCYKRVEEEQPFLQLLRIDEQPEVIKEFQEAFDYYFSRMNDETYEGYGKADGGYVVPDKNFPLYHTEEYIKNENSFIFDVFKKFQGVQNIPVYRNRHIQTRKPDTIIKYSNQNQITLQDMYSDLLMYKVPVQVVVNQKISAHISFTTKPSMHKTMYSWAERTPMDVEAKPKLLNLLYSPPVLHFFSPKPSLLKAIITGKTNIQSQPRTKGAKSSNKSAGTKTAANKNVSGVTAKVAPNAGTKTVAKLTPVNRQQIYNISKILTAVTSNSQAQIYTVPKTVMNVTHADSQTNLPIKQESSVYTNANTNSNFTNRIIVTQSNPASMSNANLNIPRQNIVFKIPFNPAKQIHRTEPQINIPIKEEFSPGINDNISKHIIVTQSASAPKSNGNNAPRPNLIFRFPYNPNSQNQHHLYQTLTSGANSPGQSGNSNVYQQHVVRNNVTHHKNQYYVPVSSFNSPHSNSSQNGLQFRNLSNGNNLLLLKNEPIHNSSNPNLGHPSVNQPHGNINSVPPNMNHAPTNGNSFYSQRNSAPPLNSAPPPINSIPSPISSVPSPISSVPSPVNTIPPQGSYTNNSFSSGGTSVSYSTDSFSPNLNSISYTANTFPSSDTSVSYSADPFPPLNPLPYTPNSFSSSPSPAPYSTDTFPPINSPTYTTNTYPPPASSPYISNTVPFSDSYTPNSYPPSDSYSTSTFPPSDSYSSNTFPPTLNSDSYTPNSYPSASYTPPQYIPPYNSEFGSFNDTSSMHLLPPQHLNTSGGKVFLRVKQPWELNQA